MKIQQTVYSALWIVFVAVGCQEDNDPLPALTQDGRGTLACRVDGEVWMPYTSDLKSRSSVARYLAKEKTLFLGGYNEDTGISIGISNYTGQVGEYVIDNFCIDLPRVENNCATLKRNLYGVNEVKAWTNKTYFGKVIIVAHTSDFVSGTFEFNLQDPKTAKTIKISEGRFDMSYITYL
ncbi:MAG: hypothetical protein EAZ70_10715 [Runella slithyformis]|nr:MAG: hypothetical protein EAY79_11160 [Runella slithyformis]TAF25175.1 MAG: hypothetical protein EAZ70_10715 [Runella slithyformis]TAF49901.1 MAG: hypothetical protein EAZ63_00015 [Runella slithyformis]